MAKVLCEDHPTTKAYKDSLPFEVDASRPEKASAPGLADLARLLGTERETTNEYKAKLNATLEQDRNGKESGRRTTGW